MRRFSIDLNLAIILVLAVFVQGWTVAHAVVPAPDAVKYAAFVGTIEELGLWAACREHDLHPFFPASAWLVGQGTQSFRAMAGTGPVSPGQALQITSALPMVLIIFPLYGMLRHLYGSRIALWGGVLFCLLPGTARLGAEGIPDSWHLFFFVSAVACLARFCFSREGQPSRSGGWLPVGCGWLVAAGAFTGLAYLCRLEALVLLPAFGLALAWKGIRGKPAFELRRPACEWLVFAAAAGAVAFPYVAVTGKLTPKHGLHFSRPQLAAEVHAAASTKPEVPPRREARDWAFPDGSPMAFPRRDRTHSSRRFGVAAAAGEFCEELAQGFGYWWAGLALLGWWKIKRSRSRLFDRLAIAFAGLFVISAIGFAAQAGYLSGRHVVVLLVLGLGIGAAGGLALGEFLSRRISWFGAQHAVPAAVVLSALVLLLPQTLEPLHGQRTNHRLACQWLNLVAASQDKVLDTHGYAGVLTSLETYTYRSAREAFADPQLAYVVVEAKELKYDSARARTLRHLLHTSAKVEAKFESPHADSDDTVLIYRWHPRGGVPSSKERRS